MVEDRRIVPNTIQYCSSTTWETDCNRVNIKITRHNILLIYSLICYFIFRLIVGLLWQGIVTGHVRDLVTVYNI
jgi:hypothetical protein